MMEHSDLTSQGGIVGTPAYMSPEQVNGEPLDPRSDLFSLGCVMYAMTAGHSPFRGENALGTARRVANTKHVSLELISKDVPAYFVQIVDRLLEKNPADRYASAKELVEELTRHLARANIGHSLHLAAAPTASWQRLAAWAILTLVFLAAAGVVLGTMRGRSVWWQGTNALVDRSGSSPDLQRTLRVAQLGQADHTRIAEALKHATRGTTIRVEDSAVYDERLSLTGATSLAAIRLESTAGATLKAFGSQPVVTVEGADGIAISGFRIETVAGQHAIEVRGACPGLVVENCTLVSPADSPVAVLYLHGGASGTRTDPIRLRGLSVRCGGVGVVMGGLGDVVPIRHVQLAESIVEGPGTDYGVALVLQVGVQQVAVRRNLFTTAIGGVSLAFDESDRASNLVIADNSLGNLHYAFTLGNSSPTQAIRIEGNLIVATQSLQVGDRGIDPYRSWFSSNWWERTNGLDEERVAAVAELKEELPLLSREPRSADYLKPRDGHVAMPGRYRPHPDRE
jgi:hypothetical protein